MRALCATEVEQHVELCETVVANLVESNLAAQEQIAAFKLLGIECDSSRYKHNE
jgi:hypothetical protein